MSSLAMAAASIKRSESQTSLSTPNSHRGGIRGQRSFSRQGSVSSRQSSFGYGSTRDGRSVCKFYLEGRCNRGSSCQFRHPQPNYSSFAAKTNTQSICKFFLKGKCTRGSSCSFRHELNDDDTISVVTMGSGVPVQYALPRQVCKYFANGYCSRGSTCNFLHESIQYNSVHVPTISYGNVPTARSQPAYSTYSAPSAPKEKPTIEAIRARAARAKEAATKETPSLSSFAHEKKSNDANEVTRVETQMKKVEITEEPRPLTSLLTPTDSNRTPMKSNISKSYSSLQSDDDDQLVSRDNGESTKESSVSFNASSERKDDNSVSDVVTKDQSNNLNCATDVTSKDVPEISQPNDAPNVSSLLATMPSYGTKAAPTLKQNLAPELIRQEPVSVKESPCTIAPKTQETSFVPVKGESQESDSCLTAEVGLEKAQSSISSSLSHAAIIAPQPTALQSVPAVANVLGTKKASSLHTASKLNEEKAAFSETPTRKASSLSQASSLFSAATRGGYSYVDSASKESVNPPAPTTKKVSSLQAASKSHNTSAFPSSPTIGTDSIQQIMDGSKKATNTPDSSPLASTHEDCNHTIAKESKSSLASMFVSSLHRASQSELHKTSNPNNEQKAKSSTSSLLAAATQRSKPEITTKSKSSLAAVSGSLITKTSSLQRYCREERRADADVFNQSSAAASSLTNSSIKEPIKSVNKLPSSAGAIQLESGAAKSSLMARAIVQEPSKPTYSSLLTASSKQSMPTISSNISQKSRSNVRDNKGQTLSSKPKSTDSSHLTAASKKPKGLMSSLASSSAAQAQRCSTREATKGPSSSIPKSTNGRVSSLKAAFESSGSGASNKPQLSWATRTRPNSNATDNKSSCRDIQNPSTDNEQVRSYASALNKASSLQAQNSPAPANSSKDSNTPVSKTNTKPKKRWGDESDSDSD